MNPQTNAGYPAWALDSPYLSNLQVESSPNHSMGGPSLGGPGFGQGFGGGSYPSAGQRNPTFQPPGAYNAQEKGPSRIRFADGWGPRHQRGGEELHPSNKEYYGGGGGTFGPSRQHPSSGTYPGGPSLHAPKGHSTFVPPPDPYGATSGQQGAWFSPPGDHLSQIPRHWTKNDVYSGRPKERIVDPFSDKIEHDTLKLNPLLAPQLDRGSSWGADERPRLIWSMIAPPQNCRIPPNSSNKSWPNTFREAATWPRLSRLKLASPRFPSDWEIDVIASDQLVGVTCGDVISAIHANVLEYAGGQEYRSVGVERQKVIGETYRQNREKWKGLGEGMRRLDFLGEDIIFDGLVDDPKAVKKAIGRSTPGIFLLLSTHPQAR